MANANGMDEEGGRLASPALPAARLPTAGFLLKCKRCEREILVEEVYNGVSHTMAVFVNCWGCLSDEDKAKVRARYRTLDSDRAD